MKDEYLRIVALNIFVNSAFISHPSSFCLVAEAGFEPATSRL